MVRLTAVLVALAVASALGVVSTQHKSRKLVTEIEREQRRAQALQVEWNQLDIEQQAVAALPTVERLARRVLKMESPTSVVSLGGVTP
ncbi:MAG: cell division protein FtsL [Candidatus Dactylopiibacterium carminicum]|uniref:Cell division protein FtsL n=1 Tax=Candidatus Dactylopiibacterium carminicum TaxID=857335 RepID=A0A272EQQ1_9RHOO|nr:cell division protein FtsL [Candidatus Dactylopiibacterium carminicum]KAF7599281.1 cell division protein FtsL [Candidatus Dactylopiibacterium carminicum]PAS92443.1 MAG: cell division protein FtsL [Candidatus Dactylopiibacterium carminicum]PAS97169.1 MAG: cell division protein FtsL [Candidatus Dactylopiibacterium carminicum]PAS99287.1 MAG: cell division protein FtsL [Candidatus Dactylopiibacterium carminicum]